MASAGTASLIAFAVTDFQGHHPVGTAAIVYAYDREHCKRVLLDRLREIYLGKDDPDNWTISPLTPASGTPRATVLLDGDY